MASYTETMSEPWTRQQGWLDSGELKESDRQIIDENRKAKPEARGWRSCSIHSKTAQKPVFSVTTPNELGQISLSIGTLAFTVTPTYERMPNGDDQPIALHPFDSALNEQAAKRAYCSFFASPDCSQDDKMRCQFPNGCFRRPRGPNGRFMPHEKYDISVREEWVEMSAGEKASEGLKLDVGGNEYRREDVIVGGPY
ncbi:hypothetical protein K432DRAFT_428384 [Lepidopterella palustris CBS 459.81]|uniref:Uncharacterized protein n=1 Tax=Lepidopterella palustris CBS 459.81 TaxID=1314670 RepID=A0A8E2E494_9PEZI|nr:hypothetical protein K432DRAFT_428384 [Lepidopterella palustris CBS 459.81]